MPDELLSPDAALMLRAIAEADTTTLPPIQPDKYEAAMEELLRTGMIGELGEITAAGRAQLAAQGEAS